MTIRITRQGGFAGIPKTTIVDMNVLSPEKRTVVKEELRKLVKNSAEGSGYDRFTYLINYHDEFGVDRQIQRSERIAAPLLQAVL